MSSPGRYGLREIVQDILYGSSPVNLILISERDGNQPRLWRQAMSIFRFLSGNSARFADDCQSTSPPGLSEHGYYPLPGVHRKDCVLAAPEGQ